MKICPFRSTAEKEVPCSTECALYCENSECAIKNMGSADLNETLKDGFYSIEMKLR